MIRKLVWLGILACLFIIGWVWAKDAHAEAFVCGEMPRCVGAWEIPDGFGMTLYVIDRVHPPDGYYYYMVGVNDSGMTLYVD